MSYYISVAKYKNMLIYQTSVWQASPFGRAVAGCVLLCRAQAVCKVKWHRCPRLQLKLLGTLHTLSMWDSVQEWLEMGGRKRGRLFILYTPALHCIIMFQNCCFFTALPLQWAISKIFNYIELCFCICTWHDIQPHCCRWWKMGGIKTRSAEGYHGRLYRAGKNRLYQGCLPFQWWAAIGR